MKNSKKALALLLTLMLAASMVSCGGNGDFGAGRRPLFWAEAPALRLLVHVASTPSMGR